MKVLPEISSTWFIVKLLFETFAVMILKNCGFQILALIPTIESEEIANAIRQLSKQL